MEANESTHAQATALWVATFFDELVRCGVRDVVVSPGSRSTALAVAAFELSQRRPFDLRLYVDVDERGAAFFALGMAKASGRPTVLVCTSGSALANYYPAVLEAETSRVPLVVLSGDRPPHMQGLGAPQTTDQLKAYGDHVRAFRSMPLAGCSARDLAFARQAAREACWAASGRAVLGAGAVGAGAADAGVGAADAGVGAADAGAGVGAAGSVQADAGAGALPAVDPQVASRGCMALAGPVHVNFPFDEPLMPDFPGADALAGGDAFTAGRSPIDASVSFGPSVLGARAELDAQAVARIEELMCTRRTVVFAGEGTCSTLSEAREVVAWARRMQVPLLADVLSGLRSADDELVIDNYENLLLNGTFPEPELIIRFGRYPVSKHVAAWVSKVRTGAGAADAGAVNAGVANAGAANAGAADASSLAVPVPRVAQLVVDVAETRDFASATDLFAPVSPLAFIRSSWAQEPGERQRTYARTWVTRNNEAREHILAVEAAEPQTADALEGAYVRKLLELAPANSCVFSANSMSIRALDTFYVKDGKPLCVLCNRGQNGIDGTVSTALGAAQHFEQTTFLTGDFTMLHDVNALALQREWLVYHAHEGRSAVIVLLNNNGGAIFDMLPQASDDPYFERLFLAPQDVRFEQVARAFNVPYAQASTVEEFSRAYQSQLGVPGVSLIEVRTPLRGVKERYGSYQR